MKPQGGAQAAIPGGEDAGRYPPDIRGVLDQRARRRVDRCWLFSLLARRVEAAHFRQLRWPLAVTAANTWGIYGLGTLRTPLLRAVAPLSILAFAVPEYIFYWCVVLSITVMIKSIYRQLIASALPIHDPPVSAGIRRAGVETEGSPDASGISLREVGRLCWCRASPSQEANP